MTVLDRFVYCTRPCPGCGLPNWRFVVRSDTGRVMLECPDCYTMASGPDDEVFFGTFVGWRTRPATVDEVVAAGWGDRIGLVLPEDPQD